MASSASVTAVLRNLTVALLMILPALSGTGVAGAHTVMLASDPPADATLTSSPSKVSATFNEDLQPAFAAMTVVGPDGNLWSSGDPDVRGPVAAIAVRPLGPSGRYTVNYRVTSADGHVVSGSWSFTLSVSGTGTPGPAATSAQPQDNRIPLWPFAIGAAGLVAAAAAWALRRRS